jgi:hypothetical protein
MTIPKKAEFNEVIKTATMFFVDETYENEILQEVAAITEDLKIKLCTINTMEGLREYIRNDKSSLANILILLGISTEKFKRIISMFRLEKGFIISTEWDLERTQREMCSNEEFMNQVCDLFMYGASTEKYEIKIPEFYRENFKIDVQTISRLSNDTELRRMVKKSLEGKYNDGLGDIINNIVEKKVKEICDNEGLTYEKKNYVQDMQRAFCFEIPNSKVPTVLIDVSYYVTTSRTQSRYKEQVEQAANVIRKNNKLSSRMMAYVNILDGAGWVGRQSDMRPIYRASDYMLNLNNLEQLKDIILYYNKH